jgi:hypothetical protein
MATCFDFQEVIIRPFELITITIVCVTFDVSLALLGFVAVVFRRYIFTFWFVGCDRLLRKGLRATQRASKVHTNNYK